MDGKVIEDEIGKYVHNFIRDEEFTAGIIGKGDYIIVSTDKRVAIASGIVSNVTDCSCTVRLERCVA